MVSSPNFSFARRFPYRNFQHKFAWFCSHFFFSLRFHHWAIYLPGKTLLSFVRIFRWKACWAGERASVFVCLCVRTYHQRMIGLQNGKCLSIRHTTHSSGCPTLRLLCLNGQCTFHIHFIFRRLFSPKMTSEIWERLESCCRAQKPKQDRSANNKRNQICN